MGSQPSKTAGKSEGARTPTTDAGPSLDSYPSFSKSDTRESARSLRGSIRSKIPGSKSDTPRSTTPNPSARTSSIAAGPDGNAGDDTDTARRSFASDRKSFSSERRSSLAPTTSNVSNTERRSSLAPSVISQTPSNEALDNSADVPQPPPSPRQSASVGQGHSDINAAQQSGEVNNVNDAPPNAASVHPPMNQQPGPSILLKKDVKIPRSTKEKWFGSMHNDSSNMEMSTLKPEDLDDMITRLLDAGYAGKVTKTVCLKNAEITALCQAVREIFLSQPSLIELAPPVKIVGDIHGQYTDLLRMFEMCGFPPTSNFLFLGDYVDRGKQSLETILLLMCYKIKFPENFFLLRGNHESANVTRVYGFYDECKRRCNIKIWKTFIDAFNCLPIASIVAGKIFCVHGGLSPSLTHMDDIRQIARPTDVPDYGLLNDLLWSDPADMQTDWESNERGVSYCFGKRVIMEFLQKHDFDLVCRAHMVVEDGYEFFTDRVLVTVFSAPNYCGEFDNWGAVMSVSGELLCSFELLKPLDSSALKNHIKKGRKERQNMLNSPPAQYAPQSY